MILGVTGIPLIANANPSFTDLNQATAGIFCTQITFANIPVNDYGTVVTINRLNYRIQIFFRLLENGIYYRKRNTDEKWNTWVTII